MGQIKNIKLDIVTDIKINNMDDIRKRLAVSVIKFLRTELESNRLGEEGSEALEVAVQCLETAYNAEGVTTNDDLLAIYQSNAPTPTPTSSTAPPRTEVSEADKQKAEEKKVEGNDFMRDGRFHDAIASYTSAITLQPNNAIYYSNRAAAYAKLQDNKNSILDCEQAVKIDPTYSKAYGRMGLAYFNDEQYEKAMEAYENALRLDPANQPYRAQLEGAREKLNGGKQQQQQQQPPQPPNPLAGMDLSSLLSNPAVMNMAQSFMSNPQVQNMFTNMMGGPPGGDGNPGPEGAAPPPTGAPPGAGMPGMPGAGAGGLDFNAVLNATSQFASQMQQQNPEMVENMRAQFQQPPPQQPAEPDEKQGEK